MLKDGSLKYGLMHRDADTNLLILQEDFDSTYQTLGHVDVEGYEVITPKKVAFFIYVNIEQRPFKQKYVPLEVLDFGTSFEDDHLVLFRQTKLGFSSLSYTFSDYQVKSQYYYWVTPNNLIRIDNYKKDLLPIVMQKPEVRRYYYTLSKKFIRNNTAEVIIKLVNIYNHD